MKLFRIFLILSFTLIIVIFSIQNSEVVEVKFLVWSGETSRALLMVSCAAIGSISTILALVPLLIGKRKSKQVEETKD